MNILNKIFKRKSQEDQIRYCRDLIYLKDNNIQFRGDTLGRRLDDYIGFCCKELGIMSDKPYIEIYREYKKHYSVYDREPALLYHKVLLLIGKIFKGNPAIHERMSFELIHSYSFPPLGKDVSIPNEIQNIVKEAWDKTLGYFSETSLDYSTLQEILIHNWAKEYEYFVFQRSTQTDEHFLEYTFKIIEDQGRDDQARTCIRNIIIRYLNDRKEKV